MKSGADWTAVWEAFHRAMEIPPERRFEFIEQIELGAAEREEVRSLLQSEAAMDGFLADPADGSPAAIADRSPGDDDEEKDDGAPDPLIGRTIGRYTVRRRIGRGGMGIVYEAEQAQPRQRIALKLLRADLVSRRALRRFTAEADILARLKHPFIARVHDAGTFDQGEGGRPYFAMELVTGEPITMFVQQQGLGSRDRLALLADVCDAVHHAHQRGVIHRDLKPGNVLVEFVDGRPRPKVLDFGVARVLDVEAAATTLTEHSEIVGTLPYMSPEQIDGRSDIGVLTDVYALGVLLHEVLAERLPYDFGSGSMLDAMQAIREQRPQALSAIQRRWRGEIETIVSKALEKESERRYQSAAALADDLRRFLRDEPILARPPSRVYHLRTFVRRNRALTIAAGIAAVILIAGAAVSTWQAVRAREAETIAIERFEDVRSLAHTVIFDLEPAIAPLPGATPARQMLVDAALEYLERLEQSAGDDPELLRELALAYERLGDVEGNPHGSNLGNVSGAHARYQQALSIWERLLTQSPADVELRHRHTRLMLRCAETSAEAIGNLRYPVRRPEFEQVLVVLRDLAAQHPRPEIRFDLVLSLYRNATVELTLKNWDAAISLFDEAIAICRELLVVERTRGPHDLEIQRTLGACLYFNAQVHRLAERPEEAWTLVSESMSIWETALEQYPRNPLLMQGVSTCRIEAARVHLAHGRPDDALAMGWKSLAMAEALLEVDAGNQRTFRLFGVVHDNMGSIFADIASDPALPIEQRIKNWREARRLYEIALAQDRERHRRGWLGPWESHYIEDGERVIAECEAAITALTARTAPGLSAGR